MVRRALLLAVVAGFLLSSASVLAGPPTEEQVQGWLKQIEAKKANFGKDGNTGQDAYFGMFEEWAKGVPVEDMTPVQLSVLQDKRLLTFSNVRERVLPRLDEFEKGTGVDSALATIIRLQLFTSHPKYMEDVEGRKAAIGRLLGHPALPEIVKGNQTTLLLRSLGEAGDTASIKRHFDKLAAMVKMLEREGAAEHMSEIFRFYEVAKGAAPNPQAAEELRASLAAYGQRALKELEQRTPAPEHLSYYRRDVATLAGADTRGQLIGHTAPELKVEWASDPKVKSLAGLRGKVVVLDFWSTHCGPCVTAFPKVAQLCERYKGLPVQVVGVTYHQGAVPLKEGYLKTGDDVAKEHELLAKYFAEHRITWPQVSTTEDANSAEYGIRGIPSYVLIDAKGIVRHKDYFNRAPLEDKFARIDALLREASIEPPAPAQDPASTPPGRAASDVTTPDKK
jgi:thiol-disulfide isomerase/thioredoxin